MRVTGSPDLEPVGFSVKIHGVLYRDSSSHKKKGMSLKHPFLFVMHYCYILYSPLIDKYYVGVTHNIEIRLSQHNNAVFKAAYTKKTHDWEVFLCITCANIIIACKIERYIKQKKCRRFIKH
jgi:putative endonuclease